jgi:hypothetical protein
MDDNEFEDAAELVGVLGRMMKRKSFETTPRMGGVSSPEPVAPSDHQIRTDYSTSDTNRSIPVTAPLQYQNARRAAEGPPITVSAPQNQPKDPVRSRANSASSKHKHTGSHDSTPRSTTNQMPGGSHETTPRAKHISMDSGGSMTPRAPQGKGGRSPATPSTVRSLDQPTGSGGLHKATPEFRASPPIPESAAVTAAYENMKTSPTSRQSPPLRRSPRSSSNLDNRNREPS